MLTRQYAEAVARGEISEPNLMHAILNVIGLVIFPFVAKPILSAITNLPEEEYKALMLERKNPYPTMDQRDVVPPQSLIRGGREVKHHKRNRGTYFILKRIVYIFLPIY